MSLTNESIPPNISVQEWTVLWFMGRIVVPSYLIGANYVSAYLDNHLYQMAWKHCHHCHNHFQFQIPEILMVEVFRLLKCLTISGRYLAYSAAIWTWAIAGTSTCHLSSKLMGFSIPHLVSWKLPVVVSSHILLSPRHRIKIYFNYFQFSREHQYKYIYNTYQCVYAYIIINIYLYVNSEWSIVFWYLNVPHVIPNFWPLSRSNTLKRRNSDPKAFKVKDFSSWKKSHSTQRGGGIDSDVVGMVGPFRWPLSVVWFDGMVWLFYSSCHRCIFKGADRIKIWYSMMCGQMHAHISLRSTCLIMHCLDEAGCCLPTICTLKCMFIFFYYMFMNCFCCIYIYIYAMEFPLS